MIRERRLTLSSRDITCRKMKIIDVALKYGYNEPGAFTRTFKRFHGITPAQANSDQSLKATLPLKFFIDIKGADQMDFSIRKKEAFTVFGTSFNISLKDGRNFIEVPGFWQEKIGDGTVSELGSEKKERVLMGICYIYDIYQQEFQLFEEDFTFMIAAQTQELLEKLTEKLLVPGLTWAVFPEKGELPGSIQTL